MESTNIRLNKFLAGRAGVSRREADDIIKEGRVSINGQKVTELPSFVNSGDEVVFDGKKIIYKIEPPVYIMLNKPQGYITAVKSEEGFRTVMELVKREILQYKHVFPVGRLDFMSEGLLLLTNDGDFAYKATHPKFNVVKSYIVEAKGDLTDDLLKKIKKGINLEKIGMIRPQNVRVISKKPGKFFLSIDLSHGKNREIRRLMEFFNLKILKLKRVSVGGLYIGDLPSGEFRILSKNVAELVFKNKISEKGSEASDDKKPHKTSSGFGDKKKRYGTASETAVEAGKGRYGYGSAHKTAGRTTDSRTGNRERKRYGTASETAVEAGKGRYGAANRTAGRASDSGRTDNRERRYKSGPKTGGRAGGRTN